MGEFFKSTDKNPAFQATISPYLILDLNLTIRAVNRAYLAVVERERADLLGRYFFDAFRPPPGHPDPGGRMLEDSLRRVLRRKRRHHMPIERFDLPSPAGDGTYVKRLWSSVNSPLRNGTGEMIGILHHTEDVTALEQFLGAESDEEPAVARMLAVAAARERMAAVDLREEAENLQRALQSRAAIEQAKGILMARHHCGPDEAFMRLRELSQTSNVKIRDLALSVISQAHVKALD
ncbi:ANTAR domain-containing protein [Amycolatopsis sp. K13G38]|uniref:ANTAR domain-containing protein n=1 Tax=Amycolatopsis acididurans TaxID=2724524 RepID=A0ABX1J3S6_9PSEU|nr:ANTAR domain-containing protein [Amycolatopsis acididurans]NKQ53589.1 ANTAR domain-containing protein [Amycolatopsis acididurans]